MPDRGWGYRNAQAGFGGSDELAFAPVRDWTSASRDRHADCAQDDDLDLSIASCTSILNNANENARDRAVAYVNRGLAWHDRHMRIRALADYSEAVGLDPTLAVAYHRRGQVWSKEGDVDRAVADYTQAILIEPNNAAYHNERCWALAIADRDLELALADCTESLRLEPNDANTLDSRGFVYLRLGRLAESVGDYDAALKINPDEAQSLFGRGIAKLRRDDTASAGADLAAAKAIKPRIADKFFRYGIYSTLITTTGSGPSKD